MPTKTTTKNPMDMMNMMPDEFWQAQNKVLSQPKNTTMMPKNVPGKGDMVDAIKTGMKRPKRANNDYPSPGRMKA